jgi:hypothetical protein
MPPPSAGDELERDTVHAITQTSWLRAAVKDMPKMTSAAAAMDLGSDQEEEAAFLRCSDCSVNWSPETGPTRPAVELGVGGEQWQIAAGTEIVAGSIFLIERARSRTLGQVLAEHRVLLVVSSRRHCSSDLTISKSFLGSSGTCRESRQPESQSGSFDKDDMTTTKHVRSSPAP